MFDDERIGPYFASSVRATDAALEDANAWITIGSRRTCETVDNADCDARATNRARLAPELIREVTREGVARSGHRRSPALAHQRSKACQSDRYAARVRSDHVFRDGCVECIEPQRAAGGRAHLDELGDHGVARAARPRFREACTVLAIPPLELHGAIVLLVINSVKHEGSRNRLFAVFPSPFPSYRR